MEPVVPEADVVPVEAPVVSVVAVGVAEVLVDVPAPLGATEVPPAVEDEVLVAEVAEARAVAIALTESDIC